MKKTTSIVLATLMTAPMLLLADMDRCVSCHGVDFEKVDAVDMSKYLK